ARHGRELDLHVLADEHLELALLEGAGAARGPYGDERRGVALVVPVPAARHRRIEGGDEVTENLLRRGLGRDAEAEGGADHRDRQRSCEKHRASLHLSSLRLEISRAALHTEGSYLDERPAHNEIA